MNLRLAFEWVREQMLSRASHRIAVGPERAAKEDDIWAAAVDEVDRFLFPEEAEEPEVDPWSDPEWVAAMGGEMAGVS
jgi:hypothetical protein